MGQRGQHQPEAGRSQQRADGGEILVRQQQHGERQPGEREDQAEAAHAAGIEQIAGERNRAGR